MEKNTERKEEKTELRKMYDKLPESVQSAVAYKGIEFLEKNFLQVITENGIADRMTEIFTFIEKTKEKIKGAGVSRDVLDVCYIVGNALIAHANGMAKDPEFSISRITGVPLPDRWEARKATSRIMSGAEALVIPHILQILTTREVTVEKLERQAEIVARIKALEAKESEKLSDAEKVEILERKLYVKSLRMEIETDKKKIESLAEEIEEIKKEISKIQEDGEEEGSEEQGEKTGTDN